MQSGFKFKIDISIYSGNKYRRKKTKLGLFYSFECNAIQHFIVRMRKKHWWYERRNK